MCRTCSLSANFTTMTYLGFQFWNHQRCYTNKHALINFSLPGRWHSMRTILCKLISDSKLNFRALERGSIVPILATVPGLRQIWKLVLWRDREISNGTDDTASDFVPMSTTDENGSSSMLTMSTIPSRSIVR